MDGESESELQPDLQRIEQAGRIAFWEWRVRDDRMIWTTHTRALFAVDRPPATYADFLALIHPDDQARVRAEAMQNLVDGGPFAHAFRILDPEGIERWILNRGETVLDPAGRPDAMLGISVDITEQKRAEALLEARGAALRESEARLRAAQETAMIGIHEWNLVDGTIIWDHNLHEIWGLEHDQPVTFEVFKAGIHPDDLEATDAAIQRALDPAGSGAYQAEYRVINRRDGTLRWVHATGRVTFESGRPVRLLGAAYEVSERRRIEEALRASETRYRLATSALPNVVYDWDLKTDRVARSQGLAGLIGVQPEDADDDRAWWNARIHPDDRAALGPQIVRALEQRAEIYELEYRVRHAAGHWVDVRDHGRLVLDDKGQVARVIGIRFDISEHKRAGKQRELLIDELNHRVRNILTIIRAIAAQTRRHSESLEAFGAAFEGRIQALATTHTLLSKLGWSRSRLDAVIEHQVATYASSARAFALSGPEVLLAPKPSLALSLVFHELASNAAKYGALSTPRGRIEIRWWVEEDGDLRTVELRWQETGGPTVRAPARTGFGSKLMDINITHEFQGTIQRDYRPEGLVCALTFAMRSEPPRASQAPA